MKGAGYVAAVLVAGSVLAAEVSTQALDAACKRKDFTACNELGDRYRWGEPEEEAKAVPLYRAACDGGLMAACGTLGYMYSTSAGGLAQDLQVATSLYRKACNGKHMDSCASLGDEHRFGRGVPKDLVAAARLFAQACEGGSGFGCNSLAYAFENGDGVVEDQARATELYRKGCDLESGDACVTLGARLADVDAAQAVTAIDRGCELGAPLCGLAESIFPSRHERPCSANVAGACLQLGLDYDQGPPRGVVRNNDKAVDAFAKACELGLASACMLAADRIYGDSPRVASLLARGCNGKDAKACLGIGVSYVKGDGVERDFARAHAAFSYACDAKLGGACTNLAALYGRGLGVKANVAQAIAFLTKACDLGDAGGCFSLAQAYDVGNGVAADRAKAAALYQAACDRKLEAACHQARLAGAKPSG